MDIQDLYNMLKVDLLEFKERNEKDIKCLEKLELNYDLLENQIRLSCGNTKLLFIKYFEDKSLLLIESVIKMENHMSFPNTMIYEVNENEIYKHLYAIKGILDKLFKNISKLSSILDYESNLQFYKKLSDDMELQCGYKSDGAFCNVIMTDGYMHNKILQIPSRCSVLLDCEISIKLNKKATDIENSTSFK